MSTKKIFITALLLGVFVCGMAGLTSSSVYASEEAVIYIESADELAVIFDEPDGNYELVCDIDMEGIDWKPKSFQGTLNGNGYSILNLTIDSVGDDTRITFDGNYKEYETHFAGLFSCVDEAVITNLNLINVKVNLDIEDNCFIGSIAGFSENSTISDCTVRGELMLNADAPMFGVSGVVGYGNGYMENITTDTTLICVDTNAAERDEQFMGGLCAAGYMNMDNCNVTIDGYVSEHGYVHNGGMMGMYFFYPRGTKYYGSITNNKVNGKITFFEDNTDRRAYCKPIVGEYLTYEFEYTGNWEDFTSDERFAYDKILMPEMCEQPDYDKIVTEPLIDEFGYTTYICKECGYSYADDYRIYVDPSASEEATDENVTMENTATADENNTSENVDKTTEESQNNTDSDNPLYKIIIVVVAVIVVISIVMVIVVLRGKSKS